MSRVLVTGMSGAGKSTILDELRRRGLLAVDTDYDGWEVSDGNWDESRMDRLLSRHQDVVVSGTVENQVHFYDRFEHIVLLSAPLEVLMQRLRAADEQSLRQVLSRARRAGALRRDDRTAPAARRDRRVRRTTPRRGAR